MERQNTGLGILDGEGSTRELLRAFLAQVPRKDQILMDWIASHEKSRVWIFGAAGIGIAVKRALVAHGISAYSFCDNDSDKVGILVDGLPVRSFSELCQDQDRIVLVAIWKYFDEILRQCEEAGVEIWDAALLGGVVFDTMEDSCDFISDHLPQLDNICQRLADERSAQVYRASLAVRLFRQRGGMKHFRSPAQYIEPEIVPLRSRETVFICGAGNGVAAVQIDRATEESIRLHLFEPDEENFSQLCATVGQMRDVHCIKKGVGRKSEHLPFCGGMGENGTFSAVGDRTAQVVSIDDYVNGTGSVPTYITMDIEGWEMEALRGAEKTILRHKPKLAVSLYHRASDFVNIPEYVLGLRPDYDIYVRHYTDSFSDTVAYFV